MAKPKVKKSKSGTQNDSVQQKKRKKFDFYQTGDGGLISDKTTEVMKKKKK